MNNYFSTNVESIDRYGKSLMKIMYIFSLGI